MDVEVCHARPHGVERVALVVDGDCTVGQACMQSGLVERCGLDGTALTFAIFGRRTTSDAVLHAGDRVELLRPLVVDPKEARRRRAAKRAAGSER